MPLYVGPDLVDCPFSPVGGTSVRRKDIALYSYTSTTQDLVDGNLIDADLTSSTYGLGKSCAMHAAASVCYSVGFVDHAVDASAWGAGATAYPSIEPSVCRLIKVVVAGVKVDAVTDGSTTIGARQMGSAGTAGAVTNGTVGTHDAYCVGVALEGDGSGTSADVLVFPRWFA